MVKAALDEERQQHQALAAQVATLTELLDQFFAMYPTSAFEGKTPASVMLIELRDRMRRLRPKK